MNLDQVILWLRRLTALDTRVFDEVRTNPGATMPGVAIAGVALLFAGIGGWLWWMLQGFGADSDILIHSAVLGSLLALMLWGVAWVGVVYLLLTQVFQERAYLEQLLRVMGLAAAPLALMGLMFVPGISFGIGVASLALTFGLTTIAVQSVTTANAGRVLVANAAGFLLWAAALSFLASSDLSTVQPHAPGVFLYVTTTSLTHDYVDSVQEFNGATLP